MRNFLQQELSIKGGDGDYQALEARIAGLEEHLLSELNYHQCLLQMLGGDNVEVSASDTGLSFK